MSNIVPKLRFKEFKDSWFNKKLGEIAQITTGNTPSTSVEEYYNGEYLFVSPSDISETRFVNTTKITLTELGFKQGRLIPKGSILFVCIGSTIGKVGQASFNCITNQQINSLEANGFNSNDFIYSLLEKNAKQIKLLAGTQAVPQINKSTFSNFKFNFPSLPEQQKIASFLSAVDEKIQQLTRKKEMLEQYKKGVMQQLFSGKLRFKDENGKPYPKWEEKTMFDVSENVSYGMNAAAIEYDGKHKYIRITDIDENSGKFNPSPLSSPDGEIEERFKLKEGDIVFARTGASVGKAYLYNRNDGDLYYAGFLIKFSIVRANPFFIYCLTQRDEYYKWVHVYSMRSGQPGLNAEEYKALKFKLPSLEEQQKIASFLTALDAKIESVAAQIAHTQTFKKGLLQQMFV